MSWSLLEQELETLKGRIYEYSNSRISNINMDINEKIRMQYTKGELVENNKLELSLSMNISNLKKERYKYEH